MARFVYQDDEYSEDDIESELSDRYVSRSDVWDDNLSYAFENDPVYGVIGLGRDVVGFDAYGNCLISFERTDFDADRFIRAFNLAPLLKDSCTSLSIARSYTSSIEDLDNDSVRLRGGILTEKLDGVAFHLAESVVKGIDGFMGHLEERIRSNCDHERDYMGSLYGVLMDDRDSVAFISMEDLMKSRGDEAESDLVDAVRAYSDSDLVVVLQGEETEQDVIARAEIKYSEMVSRRSKEGFWEEQDRLWSFRELLVLLKRDNPDHVKNSIRKMIDEGISANSMDEFGLPPLYHAVMARDRDVVTWLLDAGADPNLANCSETPLNAAAWSLDKEMFELLLSRGARIDHLNSAGENALHNLSYASGSIASERYLEFFKFLIDMGIDLNNKNDRGWTPLARLMENEAIDGCRLFVDHGADLVPAFRHCLEMYGTSLYFGHSTGERYEDFLWSILKSWDFAHDHENVMIRCLLQIDFNSWHENESLNLDMLLYGIDHMDADHINTPYGGRGDHRTVLKDMLLHGHGDDVVKRLIQRGVDFSDHSFEFLDIAAGGERYELCRFMINHGADVLAHDPDTERTWIDNLVRRGKRDIAMEMEAHALQAQSRRVRADRRADHADDTLGL